MGETLFDDDDVVLGADPVVRRQVRRAVLAGLLQVVRAQRGWSTNDAASAAKIAPMTWRRLEESNGVRQRSLAAVDGLLGLELGTVVRALEDDLQMVDLVGRIGLDVSTVSPASAGEFLDNLAERFRTGTVAGAGVAAGVGAAAAPWTRSTSRRGAGMWPVATDDMRVGLDMLSQHISSAQPPTHWLAVALIDRMRAMEQTPEIQTAVRALSMAMADIIAGAVHDGCADKGVEQEEAAREEATSV